MWSVHVYRSPKHPCMCVQGLELQWLIDSLIGTLKSNSVDPNAEDSRPGNQWIKFHSKYTPGTGKRNRTEQQGPEKKQQVTTKTELKDLNTNWTNGVMRCWWSEAECLRVRRWGNRQVRSRKGCRERGRLTKVMQCKFGGKADWEHRNTGGEQNNGHKAKGTTKTEGTKMKGTSHWLILNY